MFCCVSDLKEGEKRGEEILKKKKKRKERKVKEKDFLTNKLREIWG